MTSSTSSLPLFRLRVLVNMEKGAGVSVSTWLGACSLGWRTPICMVLAGRGDAGRTGPGACVTWISWGWKKACMGTSMSSGFFFLRFLMVGGPLSALMLGRVRSHACRTLAISQRSCRSTHLAHSMVASVPLAHTSGTSRSKMSFVLMPLSSVGCQSVHVPRTLGTPSVFTTLIVIHLI